MVYIARERTPNPSKAQAEQGAGNEPDRTRTAQAERTRRNTAKRGSNSHKTCGRPPLERIGSNQQDRLAVAEETAEPPTLRRNIKGSATNWHPGSDWVSIRWAESSAQLESSWLVFPASAGCITNATAC